MATTTLAAVFWAAGGLTSLPAALAQPQRATVLSIGDGDTIRVRQDSGLVRVRLACIDAPETSQRPWGAAARRELQELLPIGHAVEVRRKATDRYGRTVAEVFSGGRNINQALVGSGAAFVYWQYITGCDRNTYSRLEAEARLRRLGVWSIPGGITRPWNHRQSRAAGMGRDVQIIHADRCAAVLQGSTNLAVVVSSLGLVVEKVQTIAEFLDNREGALRLHAFFGTMQQFSKSD